MVFIGYLGAQVSVAVHILQFRSTHQYYRTAKYEPNWTIGDGDTLCSNFPDRSMSASQSWTGHVQVDFDLDTVRLDIDKKHNLIYLHHQWSDSVHTLQVDSTGEYFETVEYEPQRTLGLRDILWKPSRFLNFVYVITITHHHATHFETLEMDDFGAVSLQMDLSRSSGGVGWQFYDWG